MIDFPRIWKKNSKVASANASPTSTAAASTSSSAGTSRQASASAAVPAGPEAAPTRPLSVKSAGASPPQSSGKLLHINLGQQYRAGSLPNVNANNAVGAGQSNVQELTGKDILLIGQIATSATLHSIDLKVYIIPSRDVPCLGLVVDVVILLLLLLLLFFYFLL